MFSILKVDCQHLDPDAVAEGQVALQHRAPQPAGACLKFLQF